MTTATDRIGPMDILKWRAQERGITVVRLCQRYADYLPEGERLSEAEPVVLLRAVLSGIRAEATAQPATAAKEGTASPSAQPEHEPEAS